MGETNPARSAQPTTRFAAAAAKVHCRAASRSVLRAPVEEICCRKPPERTPETRPTTVMSWSARTGSRGGRKRSSLACTTYLKIARHAERRARPEYHRQPIDAQNVCAAHLVVPAAPASFGAKKQQPHGSIELAELYRTSYGRRAMDGLCGVTRHNETCLVRNVRKDQIYGTPRPGPRLSTVHLALTHSDPPSYGLGDQGGAQYQKSSSLP